LVQGIPAPRLSWYSGAKWHVTAKTAVLRPNRFQTRRAAGDNGCVHASEGPDLRALFGQAVVGAIAVIEQLEKGTFKLPQGVTRSLLEMYCDIAQRAIDQNIDKIGTQSLRRDIINRILRGHGSSLP